MIFNVNYLFRPGLALYPRDWLQSFASLPMLCKLCHYYYDILYSGDQCIELAGDLLMKCIHKELINSFKFHGRNKLWKLKALSCMASLNWWSPPGDRAARKKLPHLLLLTWRVTSDLTRFVEMQYSIQITRSRLNFSKCSGLHFWTVHSSSCDRSSRIAHTMIITLNKGPSTALIR